MKKFISLLLCIVMVFSVSIPVFAAQKEQPIKVKLCNYIDSNGKWVKSKYIKFDVNPLIENGRTLVPIRAVAEELGYDVEWQPGGIKNLITINADILDVKKDGSVKTCYENNNQLKSFIYAIRQCEDGYGKNIDGSKRKSGLSDDFLETTVDNMLYKSAEIAPCHVVAECSLKIGSKIGSSGLVMGGDNWGVIYNYIMDVTPKVVDGRTLLPLRAVGELLGLQVEWDAATRTVILTA